MKVFYKIKEKISQYILLKKYKNCEIPIKKGKYWYYKELVGLEQKHFEIQKYEFWQM